MALGSDNVEDCGRIDGGAVPDCIGAGIGDADLLTMGRALDTWLDTWLDTGLTTGLIMGFVTGLTTALITGFWATTGLVT